MMMFTITKKGNRIRNIGVWLDIKLTCVEKDSKKYKLVFTNGMNFI